MLFRVFVVNDEDGLLEVYKLREDAEKRCVVLNAMENRYDVYASVRECPIL